MSFVGSTPIAQYVYETATARGKRVQALGGAKNRMLVLPDADLDQAADAAVNAGFGSAGERCMAVSALVAVEPIADDLVAKIGEKIRDVRVGDGRRGSDMRRWSPVATAARSPTTCGRASRTGPRSSSTGATSPRTAPAPASGSAPRFDHVTPGMSIYTDEIFGPVLSVLRVASYDEALKLVNDNPYGNGVALFTNDGRTARHFQREVEVGMVGINVPIPVPVAYYSFGGWKASLFGATHAYGTQGVHFYTRTKAVTTRWPGSERQRLDLGFPQNT